jgi:hypothetical protein
MHDLTLIILAIYAIVSLRIEIVTKSWKEGWYDESGIAFSIVLVVLWYLLQVEQASVGAFLLSADEAFVKQKTKVCCTD